VIRAQALNSYVNFFVIICKVCEKYRQGKWLVVKVRDQGTYMTKGREWIAFYTTQDMKEKIKWIEESGASFLQQRLYFKSKDSDSILLGAY
jgi:hypothetical protein